MHAIALLSSTVTGALTQVLFSTQIMKYCKSRFRTRQTLLPTTKRRKSRKNCTSPSGIKRPKLTKFSIPHKLRDTQIRNGLYTLGFRCFGMSHAEILVPLMNRTETNYKSAQICGQDAGLLHWQLGQFRHDQDVRHFKFH